MLQFINLRMINTSSVKGSAGLLACLNKCGNLPRLLTQKASQAGVLRRKQARKLLPHWCHRFAAEHHVLLVVHLPALAPLAGAQVARHRLAPAAPSLQSQPVATRAQLREAPEREIYIIRIDRPSSVRSFLGFF